MRPLYPILFLDIDDVLCVDLWDRSRVQGAFNGRNRDPGAMFAELFTADSKAALTRIHAAFDGRVRYVISSNWRLAFDRTQMVRIFESAGLPFVAECLEQSAGWHTPAQVGDGRDDEIALWLQRHYGGEGYAVVDDTFSGYRLLEAVERGEPAFVDRVVICEEGVGLLDRHVPEIVAALRRSGARR